MACISRPATNLEPSGSIASDKKVEKKSETKQEINAELQACITEMMQRITVAESKIEKIINDDYESSEEDEKSSYISESENEKSGEVEHSECSHASDEKACPKTFTKEQQKKELIEMIENQQIEK